MRVVSAPSEVYEQAVGSISEKRSIGFVPTMGALHEGHLSLVRTSLEQNDKTFVSIFVNPLQFNNSDDLEKYPRVLEEDLALLEKEGVDVVFTPREDELYSPRPLVSIDFGELEKGLEGQFRPGHFSGVGVVVSKLLHLIPATHAYFGLKDLQQFLLIRKMVHDLSFPTKVVGVPTVREDSGLALSSRNLRLTQTGKEQAIVIFRGLENVRLGIKAGKSLQELMTDLRDLLSESEGFELEYAEAVNPENLRPVTSTEEIFELAVCVAGYVEGVRLIDNLYLRLK